MNKKVKIIKKESDEDFQKVLQEAEETDIFFKEIVKDKIGKSDSAPTWGEVYENKNGGLIFKGIALHKEYDYDNDIAAYSEKVWSIFGKIILDGEVRIPDIDVVEQKKRLSRNNQL